MSAHVAAEISLSSHSSSTENETKIFWPTRSSNTGVTRQNYLSLKGETTTSLRRCCALSCVVANSLLHPPGKIHQISEPLFELFKFSLKTFLLTHSLNICPYAQGKILIAELTLGIHLLRKLSEFVKCIAIQMFQTCTRGQSSPNLDTGSICFHISILPLHSVSFLAKAIFE